MRLVVKKDSRVVKEYTFAKGPVYIGRHTGSQVFLPDRAVSRQHAVIFSTHDGKFIVEDLDSVNKTYLNNEPVHKTEIKTGDYLRITDFTIEINLEQGLESTAETAAAKAGHLEDTLSATSYNIEDTLTSAPRELQITIRRPDAEHAPDIVLPSARIKDFIQATETICKTNGPDELLQSLLYITAKQFTAFHNWAALRTQPSGPMTSHAGKKRSGQSLQLSELKLSDKITQAVEESNFFLFQRIPLRLGEERIKSAIIAPIIDPAGCFGVIYVDNALDHENFSLSDLDYLMLIAIHTAAILENF